MLIATCGIALCALGGASILFGVASEELRKCLVRFRGTLGSGLRVEGSELRVQGAGCRVRGAEFRVQCSRLRVQGAVFKFQGSGFRVQG